jgi:hypothetical protein
LNEIALERGNNMEVEIIVEGEGLVEVETIRVEEGCHGREIIAAVAVKGGFPPEEGLLFLEDCDEPLDVAVVIGQENGGKIHHVHRAKKIEVSVFYQGRQLEKQFSPATRVQRVLDWAVGPQGFKIDKAIAPEMELALHGSTTALPKDAHIGRYLRHPQHELSFDLIRGVVPNGASL